MKFLKKLYETLVLWITGEIHDPVRALRACRKYLIGKDCETDKPSVYICMALSRTSNSYPPVSYRAKMKAISIVDGCISPFATLHSHLVATKKIDPRISVLSEEYCIARDVWLENLIDKLEAGKLLR